MTPTGPKPPLRGVFAIDLRSLALFRVALGVVLVAEYLTRVGDLRELYTDAGIFPAALLRETIGAGALASIHYWASPSALAVGGLFALSIAAAVALGLGWRTRIATAVSWYLLASVQVRNPHVARMGGDHLLIALLFWSLFLPLGARASLDARRRGSDPAQEPNALWTPAAAALLIQIAWLYLETGVRKTGLTWANGTALYYALHYDHFVSAFGEWFRQYRTVLAVSTPVTRLLEVAAPFLVFSPWAQGPLRSLAVALFVGFHLSLWLLMDLLMFPWVCIAAWLVFLPGWLWDRVDGLRGLALEATRAWQPPAAGLARTLHTWSQVGAMIALAYVLVVNSSRTAHDTGLVSFHLPDRALAPGRVLRLNQAWAMFAPDPMGYDAWFVLEGELADGRHHDVLRDAPVSFEPPHPLREWYPSRRWTLYLERGMLSRHPESLRRHRALADHLCRTWPARHPEEPPLLAITTWLLIQKTLPDREADPERAEVERFACGARQYGRRAPTPSSPAVAPGAIAEQLESWRPPTIPLPSRAERASQPEPSRHPVRLIGTLPPQQAARSRRSASRTARRTPYWGRDGTVSRLGTTRRLP